MCTATDWQGVADFMHEKCIWLPTNILLLLSTSRWHVLFCCSFVCRKYLFWWFVSKKNLLATVLMVRMTMICSPPCERYGNKQQKTIASKRHVRAPLSLRTVNQLQCHVVLVEKYVRLWESEILSEYQNVVYLWYWQLVLCIFFIETREFFFQKSVFSAGGKNMWFYPPAVKVHTWLWTMRFDQTTWPWTKGCGKTIVRNL